MRTCLLLAVFVAHLVVDSSRVVLAEDCAPPEHAWHPAMWLAPPLPSRGVVIGVADDPLSAYADRIGPAFPAGVPVSEAGFALGLMRAARAQQVLGGGPLLPSVPDETPLPWAPPPESSLPLPEPRLPSPTLRAISAVAAPISTRGNVDWDGLAVTLRGMDEFGRPAPLRGTFRLTLWGQSQQVVRPFGEHAVGVPDRVVRLATWTRALDGNVPEATFTVPLPDPLPDHDATRAPYGQLHVDLSAPGRGMFTATDPLVPLAQIDPVRDRHFVETGSRFRPDERTAGRPNRTGPRFFSPNAIRPDGRVLSVQP